MTEQGFTIAFTVDQTPLEAFEAITNVRGWWSEDVEGPTDQPGEEFRYAFKDAHRSRIRVTEAVPGRKVSWSVLENYFGFTSDPTEWTGTTITFEITEKDGRTEVRFTHHGLLSTEECFDVCSTGWNFYVKTSLRQLIVTGQGQPNSGGRARLATEEAVVSRTA